MTRVFDGLSSMNKSLYVSKKVGIDRSVAFWVVGTLACVITTLYFILPTKSYMTEGGL